MISPGPIELTRYARLPSNPGVHIILGDMPYIARGLGSAVERFAGRTVLVTGASGVLAGYIADALAYFNEHLLSDPARLILLVRRPPTPFSRLAHLTGRGDVLFLVQDASDPLEVQGPVDFIVHAASNATPQHFLRDPVGTIDANSLALRRLLVLAAEKGSESFLFFSSSEIYGTPDAQNIPTPETYVGTFDFTANRSYYAEAKRFGETLCAAYLEQYGVPVKSVRPFHVHGPGLRLDDGRIIAAMMLKGLRGEPLELSSDGKATRTYGYVADAVVGFLKVLLSDYNGQAFNVGADQPETSILELASAISRIFGRTEAVKTLDVQAPAGSPLRACPDLGKIRSLLGYVPGISLEDGLMRTAEWLRVQYSTQEQVP